MKDLLLVIILTLISRGASASAVRDEIKAALTQIGRLKAMEAGRIYSLPARGKVLSGTNDDFLRRREPDEILTSGLSTGCGDYSQAFYGLLRAKGASLLWIDSVELSATSLLDRFDGHAVVAARDHDTNRWILVDPTNGVILDENWDPATKIYTAPGGRFWIGFVGRLEDYPLKTPEDLKTFYNRTLQLVPADVLDREVIRLDFTAGPTMRREKGSFANPRLSAFLDRFSRVYDDLGIVPKRRERVQFSDGGPGAGGDCRQTGTDSWECSVGQDSSMSLQWFSWVERYVARHMNGTSTGPAKTGDNAPASGRGSVRRSSRSIASTLTFIVDGSMRNADGSWANPNLQEFLRSYDSVGGIQVRLTGDGHGTDGACSRVRKEWICRIGQEAAMSGRFYEYVTAAVAAR